MMDSNLSSYRKSKMTKLEEIDFMKPYLKKYENEKIIIYTNSRKETAKIADMINEYMSTRTKKLFIPKHIMLE